MNHEVKDGIQQAALVQWSRHNRRGTIAGATGMGKSKIAIDAIRMVLEENPLARIVILVPTEGLRDENWPAEFRKWCSGEQEFEELMSHIRLECYASAPAIVSERCDLLVLDEVHHLTDRSAKVFEQNMVRAVLGLSATPPRQKRDWDKHALIHAWAPVVFVYTLEQGVDDGVVADFEIVVVMEPLDNITKNIEGGTKKNPFLTTEAKQYAYLDNIVKRTMAMAPSAQKDQAVKFNLLKRTRFIYNLPSKTKLARAILDRLPTDARILTFCGSIDQARELFGEFVYTSKDKKLDMLNKFKTDMDIKRIGVVNAVDEGHNIDELDIALIVQTNSNDRTIVQRIGRVVRFRPGHKALVIVICAQGTQDESWVKKSLEEFSAERIKFIPSRMIYSGEFFENR